MFLHNLNEYACIQKAVFVGFMADTLLKIYLILGRERHQYFILSFFV